jgi:hypothetical protein
VFVSFGDESGNHTNETYPFMAIAGYVGHPSIWKVFKNHWAKTLEEYDLSAFHMTEYLRRKALPYSDWSDKRYGHCINAFIDVITTYNLSGFAVQVPREDFDSCLSSRVKKRLVHDPYVLVFDTAITMLLRRMYLIPKEQLTMYFHRTSFANKARLDYQRRKRNDPNGHRLADDVHFVSDQCLPIQAADLLANLARNYLRGLTVAREGNTLPITPQIEACLIRLNKRIKTQWRSLTKGDLEKIDKLHAAWINARNQNGRHR